MSQNIDTIYNYLVVSDNTNNTASTLNNTSINFGSNLLTTPLNTTISNSSINTPLGNIGFGEMILIRDATQAISIPIPNDNTTLKVVDTVEVASQVNPIGATKTDYSYDSITASNGLTINGTTTFSSVPKSNVLPSAPTDLVNLTYLQNNPPPSAVIFYFNNSQVPTPLISTYALLSVVENELPQSTIPTTISGIGTIQLIQGFANQLINLNGASFIPSGVWDCNFWASTVASGDDGHINIYFSVFGISSLGVETQIGVDSSTASINNTSISQYKISLALSYTDISTYESLVVKLYAINNRSGSTSIINYFESGSSYSHIHTSFGVYVPPNLLSLNNTWTGLNTFSQPINGSITGNSATSTNVITASTNLGTAIPVALLSTATPGSTQIQVDSNNQITFIPSTNTLNVLNISSATVLGTTSITSASLNTTTGGSIRITDLSSAWQTVINQVNTVLNIITPQTINFFNSTSPVNTGTSLSWNISNSRGESCLTNYQGNNSGSTSGGFDFYNVVGANPAVKFAGIPKTQSAFGSTGSNIPTYDWVNGTCKNFWLAVSNTTTAITKNVLTPIIFTGATITGNTTQFTTTNISTTGEFFVLSTGAYNISINWTNSGGGGSNPTLLLGLYTSAGVVVPNCSITNFLSAPSPFSNSVSNSFIGVLNSGVGYKFNFLTGVYGAAPGNYIVNMCLHKLM